MDVFILAVMTLYEMRAQSPYQRSFRIFACGAISLLLIILYISVWTPAGLSDQTRKIFGWGAGALVMASVVIACRLSFKEGLWKLNTGCRVELSEGKIIQKRPGVPIVEIPLDQIASLHQSRGWLIVRSSDPDKQIAVPSEIVGFETLKQRTFNKPDRLTAKS